jgi:hypothetical protein
MPTYHPRHSLKPCTYLSLSLSFFLSLSLCLSLSLSLSIYLSISLSLSPLSLSLSACTLYLSPLPRPSNLTLTTEVPDCTSNILLDHVYIYNLPEKVRIQCKEQENNQIMYFVHPYHCRQNTPLNPLNAHVWLHVLHAAAETCLMLHAK